MSKWRVVIVSSDPLARAGLAVMLGELCYVVGQVDGDDLQPDDVALFRPDVVIWDQGWDAANRDALLAFADEATVPALVLAHDDDGGRALWGGAIAGVVSRSSDAETLAVAVAALAQGLVVGMPGMLDELRPEVSAADVLEEPLTARELEVLQLLAEGLPNKQIALRLHISEHTVKFHVNALMQKLNAQSRTAAVVQATRLGLILL